MKNHELIVHFPIALLLSAFLFALIGLFLKRRLFKEIIFWNLIIGSISIGLAIYTGLQEQVNVKDPFLQEELSLHRRNAYTIITMVTGLVVWLGIRKKKMKIREYFAWVSLFFISTSCIAYQGYIGHDMSAKMQEYEIEKTKPKPAEKPMDYGWNF